MRRPASDGNLSLSRWALVREAGRTCPLATYLLASQAALLLLAVATASFTEYESSVLLAVAAATLEEGGLGEEEAGITSQQQPVRPGSGPARAVKPGRVASCVA